VSVLFILSLLLTVFALVTVIRTDDADIKYLPKLVWLLLIVFLPLLGSIVWFAIGMPRGEATQPSAFRPWPRRAEAAPATSRPAAPAPYVPSTPEDDEAAIEAEILFHEKQAEIRRLEAEVARKRAQDAGA
jgi:hypothetical protein